MPRNIILIIALLGLCALPLYYFYSEKETAGVSEESSTVTEESSTVPSETAPEVHPDFPVIYVSVVSHNEEPGLRQPDYTADEAAFWNYRNALVDWANMISEVGATYNWQSDWNFLKAIQMYDTGTPETNGKNVAVWMQEDLGFAIDPHAHESKYSYADVAYLMREIGVEPSNITGGFLAAPIEDSKVDYLNKTVQGLIYDTTWTAEAMWGGGTGLHQNEEGLWTSGIWRPASSSNFFEDDPSQIPNIGNFGSDWESLDILLNMAEAGELDPDKIYTLTIMNDQRNFFEEPGYIEEWREKFLSYSEYTEAGTLEWVTLEEVLEIWETLYDSEPNILHFNEEAAEEIFSEDSSLPSDKPKTNSGKLKFKNF